MNKLKNIWNKVNNSWSKDKKCLPICWNNIRNVHLFFLTMQVFSEGQIKFSLLDKFKWGIIPTPNKNNLIINSFYWRPILQLLYASPVDVWANSYSEKLRINTISAQLKLTSWLSFILLIEKIYLSLLLFMKHLIDDSWQ